MEFTALAALIEVAYSLALCWGCVSDVKSLQIPNGVSAALLALFFAQHFAVAPQEPLASHFIAGGLVLLATLGLYAAGLMGGGDVKLMAVLALWAGAKNVMTFLLLTSLLGGAVGGTLLILRASIVRWPRFARYIPSRRLKAWASRGIFPYGLAICSAGLALVPTFFARPG